MRAVIQRVNYASVSIEGKLFSQISKGLLVLVGIEQTDTKEDAQWLAHKIANLRIFNDDQGKMNLSVKEVDGDILVVSQFTLHASTKKGFRPSYTRAAKPDIAIPLYDQFVIYLEKELNHSIPTGQFGAYMRVSLENDGPVTIIIDTKNRE
jgi:D-tyrosyl-tRNA(Tyr) deacylase